MPLTRFKLTAIGNEGITNAKLADDAVDTEELADGAVTLAKTDSLFVNTEIAGTEAARMPVGTTAQRANAQSGDIRFNSTLNVMEYYNGTIWNGIDSPPTVSSISPTAIPDTDSAFDIVITGLNFLTGATVQAIGQDGSTINATTTTVDSNTQITANFDGTSFLDAQENYSIKVSNSSGLSITYADSLAVNASPVWTTAASPTTLATVSDGDAISGSTVQVVATDDEGASLTYSLTSGAVPTGLTVNSDGTITGTPSGDTYASGGQTFTPTITVTDGSNSVPRTFAIVKKWYDGSTSALAADSATDISNLGISTDGSFYINISGSPVEMYTYFNLNGGPYVLAMVASNSSSAYTYDNAVWTNTSGGVNTALDPASNTDQVSSAFYTLSTSRTGMILGNSGSNSAYFNYIDHTAGTARNQANGGIGEPTPSSDTGDAAANSIINLGNFPAGWRAGVVAAGAAWNDGSTFYKNGYYHATPDPSEYGYVRFGFTSDQDGSDSHDRGLGMGLKNAGGGPVGAFSTGAGWFNYSGGSKGSTQGFLLLKN